MKHKLTTAETAHLIPRILIVIQSGERWESKTLHHPVEAIVSAILSITGMKLAELKDPQYGIEGFQTNGWQWDWWQNFEFEGKGYTLSGSGYYGGHSFGLTED